VKGVGVLQRIAILKNSIQPYNWGSTTFIPELLGEESPSRIPQAEMWMGSHSKAPSLALRGGVHRSLGELIDDDPEGTLGHSVSTRYSGNLPFLFKVLASSRPLSIQAHPDRARAKMGFRRENRKEIGLDAPHRNYRDENHKPELICAMSPFWALKGFRRTGDIIRLLDMIGSPLKGLRTDLLRERPDKEGLKAFFISLMTMKDDVKEGVLAQIAERVTTLHLTAPEFAWLDRLNREYPGDIGLLSPLLLNLVRLNPGEALYIPAGELHAYLEGAGLEIMANSDNVIRGGLTGKHIDLAELIQILDFTSREPEILRPAGENRTELHYPIIAEEFALSMISVDDNGLGYESPAQRSAEIMICMEGEATVTDKSNGDNLLFKKGTSIFVPASVEQYRIMGTATIYKAFVPL
jgi:mannose-6-phosphate isomerase